MGTSSIALPFALTRHAASASRAVSAVTADIEWIAHEAIQLRYAIHGDLASIRVPDPGNARRADGLWRTTCCEAFLRPCGGPAYFELNFAPSGAWAIYRFDGYRAGMQSVDIHVPPRMEVHRNSRRLELDVLVPIAGWLEAAPSPDTVVGLAVVVEETGSLHSFWALHHPGERPDFHDARSFAATLRSTAPVTEPTEPRDRT
jgi:hypothetical protein